MKKEIYLIRHGETDWNIQGKVQGCEHDIELNDLGKEQSIKTGRYFNDYRILDKQFDWVICSPLSRAKNTCYLICDNIKYPIDDVQLLDILTETRMDKISGTTSNDDIRKQLKEIEKEYFLNHPDPIIKYEIDRHKFANNKLDINMETNKESLNRAKQLINLIKESNKEKILIVSHSGTIDFIIRKMFNICEIPKGDMTNGTNCSITYIKYNSEKNKFKLISSPNTSHMGLYK